MTKILTASTSVKLVYKIEVNYLQQLCDALIRESNIHIVLSILNQDSIPLYFFVQFLIK